MVWAKVTEGRVPPSVQMTTDVGSLRSLTRISGRRRDGLRTLLTRKTPPKGTAGFVAATLADHAEIVAQVGGNHLAADLLGCEAATYGRSAGIAALVEAASDARAQVLHARAGPGRLRVRHRRQLLAPGRPGNPPLPALPGRLRVHPVDVERRACGQDATAGSDPAEPAA